VFFRIVSAVQAAETVPMKSLYDLIGARAGDDAQAIKNAFRKAVKAYHPDLHPDDPDALLRFRQIVTANAVLRDENQRAAYDQLLELERRQIKLRLDAESVRLERARRQVRRKWMRAAALAVIASLICGYGLFMLMPTTSILAALTSKPAVGTVQAARTPAIVEAIRKDEVGASVRSIEGVESTAPPEASAAGETAGVVAVAHADVADAAVLGDRAAGSMTRPGSAVDKGVAEKPDMDKGPVNTSEVLADRGKPASASVPSGVPHDAGFYRGLGLTSYRLGDFPRAIANLDEAIRLDPEDAQARNVRGNAFDEIGAFDSALADYDEAIRIDPNNPLFFHDRAVLWHRKGDFDKALIDLDRAIRFNFSDPNLYCSRGLIWYQKGSRARATADFDHALKLNPDFATACINRGMILHRNSEFTPALTDLGRTIYVNPSVFDLSQKMK
jgi:tetratricopeptide (TPR) repeat protein